MNDYITNELAHAKWLIMLRKGIIFSMQKAVVFRNQ